MHTRPEGNSSRKVVAEFLSSSAGSPIPLTPTKPNGRQAAHPGTGATASKKTVEVASAQLEGGGNVEVVEDLRDPARTRLAVSRNGVVDFVDSVEDRGRILIPLRKDDSILWAVRLPHGVQPCESPSWLAQEIGSHVNSVVPISRGLQLISGAFVINSWIADQLPLSPCLIVRGPLEISFRFLQVLASVCRRAMVVGDATQAGVLRACSRLNPTLLIVNFGLRPAVLRTLGMGMRRGVLVLQKAGAVSSFGTKVVATTRLPADLCMVGDCFLFSLGLPCSPDVAKLLDPEIIERADYLQECLLQLRFDILSSVRPLGRDLAGPTPLRGEELIRCLGAPFAGDKQFVADLNAAAQGLFTMPSSGVSVLQRSVISALFFLTHAKERQEFILVGELADLTNELLEQQGEDLHLSSRKVGALLTDLEFADRTRVGDGCELILDRGTLEHIHRLAKFYGTFEVVRYSLSGMPGSHCELCRQFNLVSEAAIRHYNEVEKPLIEQKKRDAEAKLIERLRKDRRYILGRPHKVESRTEGKKENKSGRS